MKLNYKSRYLVGLWYAIIALVLVNGVFANGNAEKSDEHEFLCVVDTLSSESFLYTSYITLEKERPSIDNIEDQSLVYQDEELLWMLEDTTSVYVLAKKNKQNIGNFEDVAFVINRGTDESKRYEFPDDIPMRDASISPSKEIVSEGYYFQTTPTDVNFDFNGDGTRDYFIGFFESDSNDHSSYFVLSTNENGLYFESYDIGSDWKNYVSDFDFTSYTTLDYVINPVLHEDSDMYVLEQKALIVSAENENITEDSALGKITIEWSYNKENKSWKVQDTYIEWNEDEEEQAAL